MVNSTTAAAGDDYAGPRPSLLDGVRLRSALASSVRLPPSQMRKISEQLQTITRLALPVTQMPDLNALSATMIAPETLDGIRDALALFAEHLAPMGDLRQSAQDAVGAALSSHSRGVTISLGTHGLLQPAGTRAAVERAIRPLAASFLPPNIAPLGLGVATDLTDIAQHDGIALYLSPRTAIVEELLAAPDADARRMVIGNRKAEILTDCEGVLDLCTGVNVRELVPFAREAIAAARAGYSNAAQALAANLLDSTLRSCMGTRRAEITKQRPDCSPPKSLQTASAVENLALLPVWVTHEQYYPGDPVPGRFARHASAHAVGSRQYTEINTVQGIMVAVSLLGFCNE